MEVRDQTLSSVGAQDLDTSSYQVSDLEDIEFNWENSQLEMDAVFRSGIDTLCSSTTFDDLPFGGISWKPSCFGRRGRQDFSSINTRVYKTHRTSQTAEKS